MCPLMDAVTYVDAEQTFRTYRFSTIKTQGTSQALFDALQYAYHKLNFNLKAGNSRK